MRGVGKTYADHPRRCGENYVINIVMCLKQGSPPQVRGKLRTLKRPCNRFRITPAGAGKTHFNDLERRKPEDHPRRCGENTLSSEVPHFTPGSPPQVRGKRIDRIHRSGLFGITPAGAGKTLKRSFRNQPFCSGAVQISFNFSNSLNVSLQSGSAR